MQSAHGARLRGCLGPWRLRPLPHPHPRTQPLGHRHHQSHRYCHPHGPAAGGRAGFSLIELLITLAVLAVLASITVPVAQVQMQRQKEQALRSALREIREAIDAYKKAGDDGRIARDASSSGYPATLDLLAQGVEDRRDPARRKLYFLRRVPADPFDPDASNSPAGTWALRSFASDAASPAPGDDVYDVASRSAVIGLNGVAVARW